MNQGNLFPDDEAAMIAAEAEAQQADGAQTLQEGMARAQKLMSECVKFRLTISEFSPSKGFDDATKADIAEHLGMKKAAVGGTKKLYDPKCDPIKNARSVLSAAKSLVDGMTIPLEHFKGKGKDAGFRLLEIEKADALQQELEAHRFNIKAAEERLNKERGTIMEASQKLLGPKFNLDDYPQHFKLEIDWHVEPAILPEYMATVMPKTFERAQAVAVAQFENTAQTAVEEFMEEFAGVVQSWTDRLGPKTKVYPDPEGPYAQYQGAEILEIEECEGGYRKFRLGHKPKGQTKRLDVWTEPLGQKGYAALHPEADHDDKKTFKNSTIQNLMDVVSKFRNVGDMIGNPDGFNKIVNEISEHLSDLGGADDVASELRQSKSYRKNTVALMQQLSEKLEGEIVEVKKRRRKVIRKN